MAMAALGSTISHQFHKLSYFSTYTRIHPKFIDKKLWQTQIDQMYKEYPEYYEARKERKVRGEDETDQFDSGRKCHSRGKEERRAGRRSGRDRDRRDRRDGRREEHRRDRDRRRSRSRDKEYDRNREQYKHRSSRRDRDHCREHRYKDKDRNETANAMKEPTAPRVTTGTKVVEVEPAPEQETAAKRGPSAIGQDPLHNTVESLWH